MQRRYNLARLILASVIGLGLTLLMAAVDVQAQIAFISDRDWAVLQFEIYVMDADGGNQRRLTENREFDWFSVWPLDGERIAFPAERDGSWEIKDKKPI